MADQPTNRSPLEALHASERRSRDSLRVPTAPAASRFEEEQLRQETATFDQLRSQTAAWGRLRQSMGWSALVMLITLCFASIFVLVQHRSFPDGAVTLAASSVLVEAVAVFAAIWRLVLSGPPPPLAPVTGSRPPES